MFSQLLFCEELAIAVPPENDQVNVPDASWFGVVWSNVGPKSVLLNLLLTFTEVTL